MGGLGRERVEPALAADQCRGRRARGRRRPRPRRRRRTVRRRRQIHRPAARRGIDQRFAEHSRRSRSPVTRCRPARDDVRDAVTMLTAHASKGLEWDSSASRTCRRAAGPICGAAARCWGRNCSWTSLAGRGGERSCATATQLAEERRLFYVAATRARPRLLVTAVLGDEEQPSRFLDELDPVDGERSLTERAPRRAPEPVWWPNCAPRCATRTAPARCARQPPAELARLAGAGVRGADPDDWWGLAELSDDGPVARSGPSGAGQPVAHRQRSCAANCAPCCRISAPRDGDAISASLGTLVHEVAATAPPDADARRARGAARRAVGRARLRGALVRGERTLARDEDPRRARRLAARQPGRARPGRDRGGVHGARSATPC